MAWRIDEHVLRGEIDHRIRGRVTGRIWFAGRFDPVELNLAGNAWRDLAGRRLEFVNPMPEQEAERNEWIEEMNAAATEALEVEKSGLWQSGGDATPDAFDHSHPLAAQAFALSVRVIRETTEHGWVPENIVPEHPVLELTNGISKAGAKFASALDDDWPPPLEFCAMTIVRLKKAAEYLEDAQLAAQSCRDESLTEPAWLDEVLLEVAGISAATATLIDELRARLNCGE